MQKIWARLLPSSNPHQILKKKLDGYITPIDLALRELEQRRKNISLQHAVMAYLKNDIPPHFQRAEPILYLSRHVPTPNLETLSFIKHCRKNYPQLPVVIGTDTEDKFTPNNVLKRNLGKMPIRFGTDKHNKPIVKKITIVDFQTAVGKKIKDVQTIFGVPLAEFHANLLTQVSPYEFEIVDESSWVTRNHRGELLEHYKKFLSLLILHGIMFELYEPEDLPFVKNILLPAIQFVQRKFDCLPLITNLVPQELETSRDWNSYPPEVAPLLAGYDSKNIITP